VAKGVLSTNREGARDPVKELFCLNSRRWVVFMDLDHGKYPATCPYDGACHICGYSTKKEATAYFRRKEKILKEIGI